MINLLLLTNEINCYKELEKRFFKNGIKCLIVSGANNIEELISRQNINLLLVDINESNLSPAEEYFGVKNYHLGSPLKLPVIIFIPRHLVSKLDTNTAVADFVVKPVDLDELELRIKRLIKHINNSDNAEIIRCGDLMINKGTCEVSVAGKLIELTFKEYELLKFLASNKGRVFKRDALLNEVWGYDYYGGDRTVDVHIRRLRGKIEDAEHTFIDTVRNIGYRFRNGL